MPLNHLLPSSLIHTIDHLNDDEGIEKNLTNCSKFAILLKEDKFLENVVDKRV